MKTLSYTAARAELADTINEVVRDRTPVIIRKKKDAVVMMCLDDYEAWAETIYLLRSPKNAKRLTAAIDALEKGDAIEKSLEALADAQP
ncbi:MAG: type II toxin-antitoxin system prevent-host-death family antitoxin [Lentisphaeria bacterium]|nr:type II toxin-antitoxin system prevent-host-death family antitoxin [Lentisphaeria bacterium]